MYCMSFVEKKIVLLVDNNPAIARMLRRKLEKYNYSIVYSETGEKALDIVNSGENIDLILLDISPGDGLGCIDTAQMLLTLYEIPVVFLSSYLEPDIIEKIESIFRFPFLR